MTPEALQCVLPGGFRFGGGGSVAEDGAAVLAGARGERRQRILTLRHGYHGDTFGAMSVRDPDNSMHSLYQGYLGAAPVRHRAAVPLRDEEWREETSRRSPRCWSSTPVKWRR